MGLSANDLQLYQREKEWVTKCRKVVTMALLITCEKLDLATSRLLLDNSLSSFFRDGVSLLFVSEGDRRPGSNQLQKFHKALIVNR